MKVRLEERELPEREYPVIMKHLKFPNVIVLVLEGSGDLLQGSGVLLKVGGDFGYKGYSVGDVIDIDLNLWLEYDGKVILEN